MNELQQELQNTIKKFRLEKIEPFMEEDDKNEKFRMEIFNEMGQLGLTGVTTPEEFGGLALGYKDFSIVLEELAKSSVSYAVTVSVLSLIHI